MSFLPLGEPERREASSSFGAAGGVAGDVSGGGGGCDCARKEGAAREAARQRTNAAKRERVRMGVGLVIRMRGPEGSLPEGEGDRYRFFSELQNLKDFKSFVLELHILIGLQGDFA